MAVDRKRIYHKRDRLRQLRAFCHAARYQSIARAAADLGVTHSAVSMHVRALEHELEAVLFERSGRRIALSLAGQQLFAIVDSFGGGDGPSARRLHRDARRHLLGRAADRSRRRCGCLRPSAVPSATAGRERQSPGEGEHAPGGGGAEASRRERDRPHGGRRAVRVRETASTISAFSYELVLITSLDHPLAGRESVDIREVARYPAVVPHAGSYARRVGEDLARELGVELNVGVEARGWGVIKGFVQVGLGISFIPDICVRERDPLSVISLREYVEPRSFGFLARRGHRLPLAAERLIEIAEGVPWARSREGPGCNG